MQWALARRTLFDIPRAMPPLPQKPCELPIGMSHTSPRKSCWTTPGATRLSTRRLALAVFLSLFNLHLKDLITSLSVAAAAVAIVFKDYISNVINGMVLAFSNRLLIDDYVKIGHHRGRITDITLGSVQLLTDEDEVVFLPNTILFTHEIVN
jgi:hypothetical protein